MSELRIESGAIDAPGCISQGWEMVKSDYGLFILITFLMIVLTVISGLIPYVGGIINVLISGPLLCGIYRTLLMKRRGEIVSLGNMFDGFKSFLPAFLVTLIPVIPSLIFGLVIGLSMGLTNSSISSNSGMMRGFSAFLIISMIIVYLFVLFLQILLFFALPLIAERDLGVVDAVKLSVKGATQNLGGLIILVILEGLLVIAGVIALCIGILFVLPIMYAANIIAYKSVFPDTESSLFNEPPQPDYYGGMYGANN